MSLFRENYRFSWRKMEESELQDIIAQVRNNEAWASLRDLRIQQRAKAELKRRKANNV